jgi:hypothetical protein
VEEHAGPEKPVIGLALGPEFPLAVEPEVSHLPLVGVSIFL